MKYELGEDFWLGVGIILAGIVSWTTHHNIAWAIVHGCCNWFYIVYFALNQM